MSKALATKNVAAVLLGLALVVTFAFSFASPAKADTLSTLQAQVQALLAQISSLQGGTTTTGGTMSASCHTFTQNLKNGSTGGEVMWVQQFLNGNGFQVAATGAGSPGNETSHFGPATMAAVVKFQNAYKADILTPVGLTAGNGNWYAGTRAKANALCAGSTTGGTTTGGTTTGTVGGTLQISAGTQPANSLAPAGASRVPFTTFTLTNTSAAAITISGVTVQRTGLAQDAAFSGVVLVDQNGLQVGVAHTFDSNHMTTVGDTTTINPGQSMTFTVAANMQNATTLASYTGQVAAITVTGVNVTSGTVSGSLPITGAQQTINSTLTIGTVTPSNSSFDPVTRQNKSIGDKAIKFSGVRFTAGSGEDVKFFSIRWRVNGSASPSDLANVMTNVNGTTYPTVLSADGRYYTTVFPGGLLLQKGNSVDAYVQGDIAGSNASGRNVEFDIDKTSDVYFVGQTYGYGIGLGTATGGTYSTTMPHDTGFDTSKQPWFSASTVTIQGGTVTTIQNATSVASQNVAVNVPNQVLGGFQTNFRGEPVTVQGMSFTIATTSTGAGLITLVSIVDENGSVVAGPVDASGAGTTLTFSNSVTFPTGIHTFTLKGKLPSTFTNGGTIQLSTTPSGWTNPQGQISGNSVPIGTTVFSLNTMTVRGSTLAVAASPNPSSQNVVVGGQNIVFGTIQLDASQSGEDVRVSSIPVRAIEGTTGDAANLSNCGIWDGTTQLNTGSNVLNSVSGSTGGGTVNNVTLDNAITVSKGGGKSLTVSCNLSSSAATTAGHSIQLGVNSGDTWTATGLQSGSSLGSNLVVTTSQSGTMSFSAGATVAVTVDSSSPSYKPISAGTAGVTVAVIKLRATNEAFNLTKLGLTLTNSTLGTKSTGPGNAATAAGDFAPQPIQVYLYDAAGNKLGTATFVGSNLTATSSLTNSFAIARDVDTLITVKADLGSIGVSSSAGIGNIVKVDPLNFEGTGASSGTPIRGGATAGVGGIRLFKSFPSFAIDTLPSTGVADGRLMHFIVQSDTAGPIGISQFTFTLATTTATVTNVSLYGFGNADYATNPISTGGGTGGQVGTTKTGVSTTLIFTPSTPVQVNGKVYFELKGTVSAPANSSVVTGLSGDSTISLSTASAVYNVATSSSITATSSLVWSGNSTSTSATADVDWSNGFTIPGLPQGGLFTTRSN